MPVVDIKGVGKAQFPDDMSLDDIRTFLQNKYAQETISGKRDLLAPQQQTISPVNLTLSERLGQGVSDILTNTGLISNPYDAQQIGGKISAIGEFLPVIGDAAAGDEFGRALAKGDKFGMAMAGLGIIPVVGKGIKKGVKSLLVDDVAKNLDTFGTTLKNKIDFNPKAAITEYNAIPDSNNGKILNTDIARELSPDYLKDRSLSASVHEPASAFIKRRYSEILKEPPKPGENAAVLFTAGGTGAGKTTGVTGIVDTDKYQVVFDTNMSSLGPAKKKIEQALKAGKNIDIVMVYRDPVEAFLNGSLKRSIRQAKVNGTGRTVPLKAHIDSHKGSLEVTGELNKIYKDNPNVTVSAIDNSRGKGQQTELSIEQLDKFKGRDYNQVRKDILKLLEESHDKGEITTQTFKGFKE